MELWIRSQDKKILQKVNKLYVCTYAEEKGYGIYDLIYDDIDDTDVPLGFYKSKERALEVLDEIQKILIPKMVYKNITQDKDSIESINKQFSNNYHFMTNNNADIHFINHTYVYEMPKD